ncbi:hypothetical protein [Salimicrobium humidisoli]|uniref:Uncharacterized protein n=1 Tax=Salimicrobium humidisoli TaxID=2029857 RepID=A0ABX4HUZ7_9BACI|nr:hypothetical protein [Salimicrobium humidisoli]PBB06520.1 hypothetical protein CKW00_02405 [Salimicrobium humidisoli]
METKEYLEDWKRTLRRDLDDTTRELQTLRKEYRRGQKLRDIQIERLREWTEEDMEEDVKTDLTESLELLKEIKEENEERISWLETSKKSTEFMIRKIDEELGLNGMGEM